MSDKIVSVRMPESLVEELKDLAERNHFLDVSEEIRSVLRDRWLEHKDPYATHLTAIRKSVAETTIPEKIKVLKKDLNRLLEEINELS